MAEYRTVKVSMWAQDEWFMDLDAESKLLWVYLFTNAHTSVAGIYKLPLRTIAFETGLTVSQASSIMQQFAAAGKAFHEDGVVWVVKMREHQSTSSSKVVKRIELDLDAIPDTPLKKRYLARYGIDTVSVGYPRSASDTDTETDTDTERETEQERAAGLPEDVIDTLKSQYENILGAMPPAIFPDARTYMLRLSERGAADWWLLALRETVSHANRPGWQYMKSVLESWIAAGSPTQKEQRTNGKSYAGIRRDPKDPGSREPTPAERADFERAMAAIGQAATA